MKRFLVKLDEDLPPLLKTALESVSCRVDTVTDEGLSGTTDSSLFNVVKSDGRFLVTADKGFGDIRKYPPGSHPGILVLRPDDDGIRPLVDLMERVLTSYRLESLGGCVAVANPRGLRIRKPA
ncbi:MAG: DUF5615 family PIN-like protein [Candidatus Hydrogenedentes bacterium]|nr:DUF5615 family PIN-like protein [Candidatus Hydrogenedentota bacterium]